MLSFNKYWTDLMKINYLQRFIIVNSYLYYELDDSVITDKQFDEAAKQLVELQKNYDIRKTQYGYVFYDFDGTTGFDLWERLTVVDKTVIKTIVRLRER